MSEYSDYTVLLEEEDVPEPFREPDTLQKMCITTLKPIGSNLNNTTKEFLWYIYPHLARPVSDPVSVDVHVARFRSKWKELINWIHDFPNIHDSNPELLAMIKKIACRIATDLKCSFCGHEMRLKFRITMFNVNFRCAMCGNYKIYGELNLT